MPAPDADEILAGLDPEQREVALALKGPVCVLAGAGTGKTRAMTHRIAYGVRAGVYAPGTVLALTFTARAAGEMRTRLRELGVAGVQARTFHAAALRQLQYFWPKAIGGPMPELMPHKVPLVAEVARRLRLPMDRASLRDVASEIEWAKVSLVAPDDYVLRTQQLKRPGVGSFDAPTVAKVLRGYEEIKRERGVIDFEDVLLLMAGILADRDDIAEMVRMQYRVFVVDEYQDVSPLQQRLLDMWLGGRNDLCVVGDAAQTIYSFTGATPKFLLEFGQRHRGAKVIKLVRDYRSTPQVVALANRLLARSQGATRRHKLELVAQRPDGPRPQMVEYPDDAAEAAGVAAQIKQLLAAGAVPLREMAVLFRTNSQSEALEQALTAANLPYLVRGGERFFERQEVRQAMQALRTQLASAEGDDEVAVVVRMVLGSLGWRAEAPQGTGAVRDRWESLQALVNLADDHAELEDTSFESYVRELQARAEASHAPSVEGVTLASLHAAKGLEWDSVWLVGLSEGLMPISFAQDLEDVEEERRLFYVGITRAREHLTLSFSLSRDGSRSNRRASRFLADLRGGAGLPDAPGAGSGRAAAGARSRRSTAGKPVSDACTRCGKTLRSGQELTLGLCADCPVEYNEALLEALKAWRKETASESKVPPYVVFTDKTLEAIAVKLPKAEGEFLAIVGIGPAKFSKYGGDLVRLVAEHA
ncbi:ATP-dependent DNA helicase UvrD2 [Micrococcales bacterium 31B]|nr:ATP-dependent DNA helicase UvrD2 [Micrococcales bacterium 31B]